MKTDWMKEWQKRVENGTATSTASIRDIAEWAASRERRRIREAVGMVPGKSVESSDGMYTDVDKVVYLSDVITAIDKEDTEG
jgi:hypothetical protein